MISIYMDSSLCVDTVPVSPEIISLFYIDVVPVWQKAIGGLLWDDVIISVRCGRITRKPRGQRLVLFDKAEDSSSDKAEDSSSFLSLSRSLS